MKSHSTTASQNWRKTGAPWRSSARDGRKLYGRIYISTEVYNEVVIDGAGLPGALQAAQADWIKVRPVQNTSGLAAALAKIGLGAGELSVCGSPV